MAQVGIFGASGFVGTALTLRLLDLGHQVQALVRRPADWPLQHNNLKVTKGSIADADCVSRVLEECDCAFYLVHGLAEAGADFEYQEALGATRFAQTARKQRFKKVIYLGGLGPDGELSSHLRSRHLVGEILGLALPAAIEFRASIVLGPQSTSFEMLKALTQRLPFRPYAPWLETLCQPIALENLLQYLTAAIDCEVLGHTVVEIGAPEVLPYGELLDHMIRLEGLTRPKFLLPPVEQRLLLPVLDLVIPEFAEVGKKLFLSLQHPTVVTDGKARELFPEITPMSVAEALRMAHEASTTSYPALWEGDFWKELRELARHQTRHGQERLVEKLKDMSLGYSEKILRKSLWRRKDQ